jgi:two-component system, NtrC family, sensor kinase
MPVRLSIRTKVLATYALLAVLVLVILLTGLTRLKQIGRGLNIVQNGYMPIAKTVNSLSTFYHLDETFDAQKIIANRDNKRFIESTTVWGRKLFQSNLTTSLEKARKMLVDNPSETEERRINRFGEIMTEAIRQNDRYIDIIGQILADANRNDFSVASAKNDELLAQKRLVRGRIDFLSRQVDDRIRIGIHNTVLQERKAVFWTIGLSSATLFLAALIGFIVLLALRPLAVLKEAARKIAEGDLHRRVQIHSKDEIGALASEFNRMADSIEQRDEALRVQQEQLLQSEKMAVVGRMASKISHEVRNPLNALSLNIEMLSDEVKERNARETLNAMSNEIDRLNAVAENYLSLARSKKPQREDTDVSALLQNIRVLIRPEVEKKKLKFNVSTSPDLPRVKVDPVRMEQALLNLFRNAMDAMEEEKSFGVNVSQVNGAVQLEVWDEGKGIPPQAVPHIFEPFYTTKEKGTGLGLSITHEIVREQGGTIRCESTPGKGTRFELTLPAHA